MALFESYERRIDKINSIAMESLLSRKLRRLLRMPVLMYTT